jgi:YD repeat-containing protein
VDISIPLYTVQGRQLSLPVTLRFHASGLRSSDYEGPAGLGWALDVGGHISRSVRGYPDEMVPFARNLGPNTTPDFEMLFGTTLSGQEKNAESGYNSSFASEPLWAWNPSWPNRPGEYRDTEYDIFTYRLPNGKSGKFILKDNNGIKTPLVIPYESVKVTVSPNPVTVGYTFDSFTIRDTDGTGYNFSVKDANLGDNYISYASTWYLVSIVSADGKDEIRLTYEPKKTAARNLDDDEMVEVSDKYRHFNGEFGLGYDPSLENVIGDKLMMDNVDQGQGNNGTISQKYSPLASILFEGGEVKFNYASSGLSVMTLGSIQVKDLLTPKTLKTISFSTVGAPSKPALLKTLTIGDGSSASVEVYRFDYHYEDELPNYNTLMSNHDYWGFYRANGPGFLASDVVGYYKAEYYGTETYRTTNVGSGYSHTPLERSMETGMIKSITYPTGGRTEFDYEPNAFTYEGSTFQGPGLRIKSVVNTPDPAYPAKRETRTFAYSAPRIPEFMLPAEIRYSSNPGHRNNYTEREMLVYLRAESAGVGSDIRSIGYYAIRTYRNALPKEYYDLMSSLISYGNVTEYLGTASVNSGKTVSLYSNMAELETQNWTHEPEYVHQTPDPRQRIDPRNYWLAIPRITSKVQYDSSGKPVHKSTYTYSRLTRSEEAYDLPVFRYREHHAIDLIESGETSIQGHLVRLAYNAEEYASYDPRLDYTGGFGYHNQTYNTGAVKLASVTETSYAGGVATVSSTESYTYNGHGLLSGKSKTNSDGKVSKTTYRYPSDIASGVYSAMASSKNMLAIPVEVTEWYDNKVIGGTLTTYNTTYRPEYLYALKQQQGLSFAVYSGGTVGSYYLRPAESQIVSYDDKGNVREVKEKGLTTTYLWSYNSRYPVAEIRNASYSQVVAALGSTAISTLSNSPSPVAATLSALRGSSALNGALVTTYTYQPLVGLTSSTDPSGRKTSYSYDTFGRLKDIRDADNNILESYEYHYKN